MKTTIFERVFIIGVSLILNKMFLFWLIGTSNIFGFLVAFVLLIMNFVILGKSIDRIVDVYEASKKDKRDFFVKR